MSLSGAEEGPFNHQRGPEDDPLSLQPPSGCGAAWPRDLATGRRRSFGYRRLFVLLRREAEPSGINRIYRHYREEALASASDELAARPWGPGPDPGGGQAQCTLVAGLRS